MSKYRVFATTENGNGYAEVLSETDDLSDVTIRVGMFSKDVVITIEEVENE